MANVAVVGAQWGDEGKGKIVDWLSARADVVVRFQGGHNAGHTLVIDGKVYKLSLLPSGVVRKGCIGVIGSGVVVDPFALLAEIDRIAAQGVSVTPETLMIAENASLILPVHSELDAMRESAASGIKIGICGQAPSNYPEFAAFLVEEGIDSISLNPDSFVATVRRVAEEEQRLGAATAPRTGEAVR